MTSQQHQPVLLQESIDALVVKEDGIYLDATFGRGGHSQAILQRLGAQGRLLMTDRDPQAIAVAKETFGDDGRCDICQCAFSGLQDWLEKLGYAGRLNGVLMDLGVSSPQLDQAERGFSFLREGPLDMRMDPTVGETAAQWLAKASEQELSRLIRDYGEEYQARRIAKQLVRARHKAPISSTTQLAELVAEAKGWRSRRGGKKIHPATKTFQAIRMAVNRELEELKISLNTALSALATG
ncbi:MAG: 16S rRNA (cytosine(1402)-N(4))-methyltransferase RsmH, partial [Gammaproteobacteria bacterium]|nr:16S rRNA (cytosine(1402)-N(4))-methyltransferase RsmH [Gammaproteobacteria bacterium]